MQAILIVRHFLLAVLLISCAYTDLAQSKIYNFITFPAIFLGLLVSYVYGGIITEGMAGISLAGSLAAMGIVLLLFTWPYLRGGIAAGDIKLMLAVAAIGGLNDYFTVYALLYSTLLGAFMAVMVFIWKGRLREGLRSTASFVLSIGHVQKEDRGNYEKMTGLTIPYGSAIAIGTMIAWFVVEI